MGNIGTLEEIIKYSFKNKDLLTHALMHKSYSYENNLKQNNQRLEFFGDSILSFCVTEHLYQKYPSLKEGELSKTRAGVVCEDALARFAGEIHLNRFLLMGHGEKANGGSDKASVLADAFEALIAAIYLDSNDLNFLREFIVQFVEKDLTANETLKDYKTLLQEYIQKDGDFKIEYVTIKEEGPAHDKKFEVEVFCNSKSFGVGSGRNKRLAQQNAAKEALKKLKVK